MDNLLVITNIDILKKLENIEQQSIDKQNSKKSTWAKIFGQ